MDFGAPRHCPLFGSRSTDVEVVAEANSDKYYALLSVNIEDVEKKISNKQEVFYSFGSRGDPLPTTFKLILQFGTIYDGWLSAFVESSRHASITNIKRVLYSDRWVKLEKCFTQPYLRAERTNAGDSLGEDSQDEDSEDGAFYAEARFGARRIRTYKEESVLSPEGTGIKTGIKRFHEFTSSSKGKWRFEMQILYAHKDPATQVSIEEGRHTRQQGDLLSLFESKKNADITFGFDDGQKIPAHKVILSARAPYFESMFDSGMKEASSNEIRVQDVEPNVFKAVLQHLYSGAAPVNLAEIALEVHAAADKYGLDELKELCESCVCATLTADNVVDVFMLAEERSCVKIRDRALVVLRDNFESLQQESAQKLKDNPELLFQLTMEFSKM